MFELLVIALLIWLWVVERRLHTLRSTVAAYELDLQGLKSTQNTASADVQRLRKSIDRLENLPPEATPDAAMPEGTPVMNPGTPEEPTKGSLYTQIEATLPH